MRKIALMLCVLASLAYGQAQADKLTGYMSYLNGATSEARYIVRDMVEKKDLWIEHWTHAMRLSQSSDDFVGRKTSVDEVVKSSFSARDRLIETRRLWAQEVRSSEKDAETYFRHVFDTDPPDLQPGKRTFGYIEQRSVEDDDVLESWPAFAEMEVDKKTDIRTVTITTYLPGGEVHVEIRSYTDDYYLPIREGSLRAGPQGLRSYILYTRLQE